MSQGLIMFRFCGHVFHSDCVCNLVSGLTENDPALGNIGCPYKCYQNPELTAGIDPDLLQDLPPRAVKLQLDYENFESEILRENFTEFLTFVIYWYPLKFPGTTNRVPKPRGQCPARRCEFRDWGNEKKARAVKIRQSQSNRGTKAEKLGPARCLCTPRAGHVGEQKFRAWVQIFLHVQWTDGRLTQTMESGHLLYAGKPSRPSNFFPLTLLGHKKIH